MTETKPESGTPAPSGAGDPDPRIGRVLAGKYRIERVVGQGGLGRVYEATHLTLGSPVAVKYILAEAAAGAQTRARFRREAAALSRLHHPGIVAAYDYGEDGAELFLVMEFVRGRSLDRLIHADGVALPFARVVSIAEQVLQVVEAAHREGIVHRDLKPENVMILDADERVDHVKVLDFGIALMDDGEGGQRLTATNAVQGTPLYMSPEQCRGRDVGPPTDVYALGSMLYEMLSGETPFSGESLVDVMAQHMFTIPPPIAERGYCRQVPDELERLARWALAKRPEDRPTASELRDALGAMARGVGMAQLAALSTDERIRAMTLTRSERGLPHAELATSATLHAAAPSGDATRPLVVLWGFDKTRGRELANALGVNGLDARTWSGDAPAVTELGEVRVVVLAGPDAAARAARLRADPATARLPIVVADVGSATDTPALVRAGASDVCLAAVGDDVTSNKLWRLLRRGR